MLQYVVQTNTVNIPHTDVTKSIIYFIGLFVIVNGFFALVDRCILYETDMKLKLYKVMVLRLHTFG